MRRPCSLGLSPSSSSSSSLCLIPASIARTEEEREHSLFYPGQKLHCFQPRKKERRERKRTFIIQEEGGKGKITRIYDICFSLLQLSPLFFYLSFSSFFFYGGLIGRVSSPPSLFLFPLSFPRSHLSWRLMLPAVAPSSSSFLFFFLPLSGGGALPKSMTHLSLSLLRRRHSLLVMEGGKVPEGKKKKEKKTKGNTAITNPATTYPITSTTT